MASSLKRFQTIVRGAHNYLIPPVSKLIESGALHSFDERNVHPDIEKITKKLFDDGHYSQATFEAFKYVDKKVQKLSKINKSGYQLMMQAFNESSPKIKLTNLSNTSEIDEQQGYKFIFLAR